MNLEAPLVDAEATRAFRTDELLRNHLMAAYLRMLAFYGLRRLPDGVVVKAASWDDRKGNWFTQESHNNLRITRILKCLALLGLPQEAQSFEHALHALCDGETDCDIGATARAYWRAAVAPSPAKETSTRATRRNRR